MAILGAIHVYPILLSDSRFILSPLFYLQVKSGCFSHRLDPDINKIVAEFLDSYKVLQDYVDSNLSTAPLTVSWKVHLVSHLPMYLRDRDRGLALVSEQVSESAHHDMKPITQSFKRKETHPLHGKFSKKACSIYSSRHLGGPSASS